MEDLDFDDWVDQVYMFMHFLNLLKPTVSCPEVSPIYVSNTIDSGSITKMTTDKTLLIYNQFPQSDRSNQANNHLHCVCKWFGTTEHPPGLTNTAYTAFLHYTECFFQKDGHLWRRDLQGCHKVVINCNKQPAILGAAHNTTGHHRDFATCAHIIDHFWWPHLSANIAWFVRTCHIWQLHQTYTVLIPLIVATLMPLFAKMYMDTMYLPKSGGFKYFVQGHCSLAHFPEYDSLHMETVKTIGDWIFEDILC